MSEEEVKFNLIFANEDASRELTVSVAKTVRDVKNTIMQICPQNGVERIRLFAGGRELGGKDADDSADDAKLRDAKLPLQAPPIPVHVQMVLKKTTEHTSEQETTKPSQCFCIVL